MKTIYLIKAHNFDTAGEVLVATSSYDTAKAMETALLKERDAVKKSGRLFFDPERDRCLARCLSYSNSYWLTAKKGDRRLYPATFGLQKVVCDHEK